MAATGRPRSPTRFIGALPPLALLELAAAFPAHANVQKWRDAIRLYIDGYVAPMSARSAYGVMPLRVYMGRLPRRCTAPWQANCVPLLYADPAGSWWLGVTSHLESHGALLFGAAKMFGKAEYGWLALQQMEWVMGNNPFGACLMTGEGWRNSYPYSRFVGPIIGGIVNGIAGNAQDVPILEMEYGNDWRTGEYWTPHNAFYLCGRSPSSRPARKPAVPGGPS